MPAQIQEGSLQQAVANFHLHGFAVVSGMFDSREIHGWKSEADRLGHLEIINSGNLRSPFKHPQAPFPQTIDPVLDISPVFRALADEERVQHLLRALFQEDALLFKDALYFHPPGAHNENWRQDFTSGWDEIEAADALSLLFLIDPADANNGCIELYEDYHHQLITPLTEQHALDMQRLRSVQAEPGDIVIIHPLTPHRNGSNLTTYPRRSLNLVYNAAHCGDLHDVYYERNRQQRESEQPGMAFL